MKNRKKKAVVNLVSASDNRLDEEGDPQAPSLIPIMGSRDPKIKPAINIVARWSYAEPTPALLTLLRLLLSPSQEGGER